MLTYEEQFQNVLGMLWFTFLRSFCHLPEHFLIISKHLLKGQLNNMLERDQKIQLCEFNLSFL